jgi:hypothetical protein
MVKTYLGERGVNPENYFRLNVEVGVGEFGMNEWNRLADIGTSTRRYLAKSEVQKQNVDAAVKLARIYRARARMMYGNYGGRGPPNGMVTDGSLAMIPEPEPFAVELPADVPPTSHPHPHQYPESTLNPASANDKFSVISSDEYPQHVSSAPPPPPRRSGELTPNSRSSNEYPPRRSNESFDQGANRPPPPLPPKTPLPYPDDGDGSAEARRDREQRARSNDRTSLGRPVAPQDLPYPENDGPPPVVNKAKKPAYIRRM